MILRELYFFRKPLMCSVVIIRRFGAKSFKPFKMPKENREYLQELQKQRKRLKAQTAKYPPSNIYLQVIGNGTRAESRSVLLVTDHTHYLFNCGEGTQRLSTEHKTKLSKIEHIFVTKPSWNNLGGVPGVALTIQETGVPKITLHGPDGLIDIVEATKNFVTLNTLEVDSVNTQQNFTDQTMTVTYVTMENPAIPKPKRDEITTEQINTKIYLDNINYYDYQNTINNSPRKRTHSPSQIPPRLIMNTKSRIDSIMTFFCKVFPKAGTLDIEKCVDAGVTPGPNLGKLKNGEDITLDDGTVVRSKDVVSPTEPGPLFIVLECPDESWMEVFIKHETFLKHQNAVKEEDIPSFILHFTPEQVLNNPKYKEWMDKFGSKTEHLIVNESNTGFSSEAMHKMQYQLNLIHPEIFPLLQRNEPTEQDNETPRIRHCKTLNKIHLRPATGFEDCRVQIPHEEYVKSAFEIEGFSEALSEMHSEVNVKMDELSKEEYPKILMLGTGSSIPNKNRNTSGILLQIDENRSIILDCGEGTIGQMVRFFGENETDRILKTIKAIYISHLHADHHLGLIGILKQRERVTDEPLFVLAPQQIASYLNFYNNRFENITNQFRLVSNRDLMEGQNILAATLSHDMNELLDSAKINTCYVTHCPFSYGVSITLKNGYKISYSGDTIPCESFIRLAKNSNLFIHEATMEDGLENEAIIKRHSTISQAVNVGMKSESKFILLTHFSQRYSKIPMLPDDQGKEFNIVGVSFDFMHISLSQLKLLPLMYPTTEKMFSEFKQMLDGRKLHREIKKELGMKSKEDVDKHMANMLN